MCVCVCVCVWVWVLNILIVNIFLQTLYVNFEHNDIH